MGREGAGRMLRARSSFFIPCRCEKDLSFFILSGAFLRGIVYALILDISVPVGVSLRIGIYPAVS